MQLNTLSRYLLAIACAFAICVTAQNGNAQDDDKTEDKQEKKSETKFAIGSKAPELDIEHWISDNNGAFEHITKFEKDKIYVIEFMATRSPLSLQAMPQMAKLQAEYEDKDVQIVSISPEDLDTVEDFLETTIPGQDKDSDAKQTFGDLSSTYCLTADPDRSVLEDYLKVAGRIGFPNAFIVGKTGVIEWIGPPTAIAKPLEEVVAGKWDREKFQKQFAENQKKVEEATKKAQVMQRKLQKGMSAFQEKMQAGEEDEAFEELGKLIEDDELEPARIQLETMRLQLMISTENEKAVKTFSKFAEDYKEDGQTLNVVTWGVFELFESKGGDIDSKILKVARKAAEYAAKAEPKSGAILDTLAHYIYIVDEDLDKAIETQKKAVEFAGPQLAEIKPFLDELMKEKKTGKKPKKKKVESDF